MPESAANAHDPATDDREGQDADPAVDAAPVREEITLEIDNYVLEWLNAQAGDLDDVINQVLHDYIAAEEAAAAATPEAPAVTEARNEDDQ